MSLSIFYSIEFYLFISLIGLAGFPILFFILRNISDRGYAVSKLFSVIFIAYFTWLLGHGILPFSQLTITVVLLIFVIVSIFLLKKRGPEIIHFLREHKKLILIEELLFFLFFIFFLFVRFGNPDLWHPYMGGEKPMDFAFINAIVNTKNLPPYDPWLSGSTISYYYFGLFIIATFVKLIHIPASFLYNLFLPFLFAQTALLAFSLLHSATRKATAGFLGALFLIGIGNLSQLKLIIESFSIPPPINAWYWNATRIMPNFEINEFPYFSFLYADPHSHLIGLPIGILAIIFGFEIFKSKNYKTLALLLFPLGILLGIIRMTNIWDYPTFTGILLIAVITKVLMLNRIRPFIKKFSTAIALGAMLILISMLSILPFVINYKTGSLGISFYTGPATRINDYILIHGFFLFILISFFAIKFFITSLKKVQKKKRVLLLIPLIFLAFFVSLNNQFLSFLSLLLLFAIYSFITPSFSKYEKPALFLSITALLLTALPDLVDTKLGLGRMNTVFKFYFQAWLLFAFSSAFFVNSINQILKKRKFIFISWNAIFALLFLISFSYIPSATLAKINDRISNVNEFTLDGESYMKHSTYSDQGQVIRLKEDYDAILWIRKNIAYPNIILEATTPIYRWGSRVSIYTGLPTVLGWDWHEIAHRQYDAPELIHSRASDIRSIYESIDQKMTISLLQKYKVSYIYLGQNEKIYYNTIGLESLVSTMPQRFKLVYTTQRTTIYQFK